MKKVLRLVQLYILFVMSVSIYAILTDCADIWHYILVISSFGAIVSLLIKQE